jgi:hypothetical protein
VAVAVCVSVPLVPVTVSVYVPLGADPGTVTVKVEELVAGFGLKLPEAPDGRSLTDNATAPANPPVAVMLMVYVTVPPRCRDREEGLTESEKSGTGGLFTTSVTLAVCVRFPLAPVMVRVKLPVCAVAVVDTVKVDVPVVEVGLKLPLAPVPKPVALRSTVPAKPFCGVTVTV